MTFREIFDRGAGDFLHTSEYEQAGIELVENTPQEIADVVLEMESRQSGRWQSSEEDEELQRRFWQLFPRRSTAPPHQRLHGEIRGRIGANFLRQHRDWLN
jgi:hypothetical protein